MARLLFVTSVLAIVSAGVVGCQQSGSSRSPLPFVFRSLDLNQRRKDGLRDYLKSPEARYELS